MNEEEQQIEDPRHWKNWISTGDMIQLAIVATLLIVSYTKLTARTDELSTELSGMNAAVMQLHEALDQVRTRQSMTPEAAARIGILETRMTALENERQDMGLRLTRIEDKLDDLRKDLRK